MEMNVEQPIAASREQVWAALNDTEVLKASIPGCDSLEVTGEDSFKAQITAKVGPVKARFSFDVSLTDIDPPNGYTINGQGQGGAAGFANGSAAVSLREDGANTILAYQAKANVGGKLAQLGARLIDGTAAKLAGEFFTNFCAIVEGESEATDLHAVETEIPAVTSASTTLGLPTWMWITVALVVFVSVIQSMD